MYWLLKPLHISMLVGEEWLPRALRVAPPLPSAPSQDFLTIAGPAAMPSTAVVCSSTPETSYLRRQKVVEPARSREGT